MPKSDYIKTKKVLNPFYDYGIIMLRDSANHRICYIDDFDGNFADPDVYGYSIVYEQNYAKPYLFNNIDNVVHRIFSTKQFKSYSDTVQVVVIKLNEEEKNLNRWQSIRSIFYEQDFTCKIVEYLLGLLKEENGGFKNGKN